MKTEEQKKKLHLNRKFLIAFFGLLLIDFIFYKVSGEARNGPPSFGWYLFLITTILCGISFLGWIITFILESISSYGKESKNNRKDKNSS